MKAPRPTSYAASLGLCALVLLAAPWFVRAQATPTPITVGQTIAGNLAPGTNSTCLSGIPANRFQFSVSATTVVTIDVNSTAFDTYVCLRNSLDQFVAFDENSGSGTNSRLIRSLTTGSYFIEVSTRSAGGGGGAYTLSLQPGYPPGTPISLGQSPNGNLTTSAAKSSCITGVPADRYQFSVAATTTVTIDLTSSVFDTYVCILNAQNQFLAFDENSGSGTNSRLIRSLTTGSYYIEVSTRSAGGGGGAYTLSLQSGVPPGTPLSLGQSLTGNLSTLAPKSTCISGVPADRYQFSVAATTVVTIDAGSTTFDTYVCILNSLNQLVDSDENSGSGTNSRLVRSLTIGSYFVEVSTRTAGGGGGAYTLSLQSGPPPGTPITLGQSLNGELTASAAKSTCITGVPADRYQFSVSATTTVTINLSSSVFDTHVCLRNTLDQFVASDENSGAGTNSRLIRSLTTGSYFIEVSTRTVGGGGGAYTLSLQSGYPPGTPIGVGQISSGNLTALAAKSTCLSTVPADRYQFSLSSTSVVTIDLTSSVFDSYVCLFNNQNQLLDSDDNSGSGTNSRLYRSLTTGSYYIEVTTRSAGGVGGAYTLSLQSGYPPGIPVSLGGSLTGNLTSAVAKSTCRTGVPADRYQFSLSASTAVSISVTSTAFSPYLCLFNNLNSLLDVNAAAITRTLTAGSAYYVEVTTLSSGGAGGAYTLTGLTLQPSSGNQLSLTPATLTFSTTAGTQVVAPQQIAVSTSTAGAAFTASAATTSGGAWLAVTPASGTTPGNLAVSVNAAGLTAGAYLGSVTVNSPGATPAVISVPVTLTVTAGVAQIFVAPTAMIFEAVSGYGNPPLQNLIIAHQGAGTLSYTVQPGPANPWLTLSANAGSATSTLPGIVQVTADVAGLAPGTYSGALTVQSGSQSQTVPVTLIITQPAQTILVSRSGLLFTGVQGGGVLPAQSFGVLNAGRGTLNWTAAASAFSGGNWLSVTPASGNSEAASTTVPQVDVRVDSTGLAAGSYSGTVQVASSGAVNSPQTVTVFLTVLPTGGNPGVQVQPTGLIFVSSGAQTVSLGKAGPGNLSFNAVASAASGGNWLTVTPSSGTLAPGTPSTLNVQAASGTLASGIYQGTVTLTFGDASTQVVNALLVVPSATEASKVPGASACTPLQLVTVVRSIGANFSSPANWPTNIEALVVDNCGTARADATVVATFSNGDPPLVLVSLKNGTYSGTWRPLTTAASMRITVRATLSPLTAVEAQVQGQVAANASAPVLYPGGIVHAASFASGAPLAPGGIVSLFGSKMATTDAAARVPLPTTLGNTTLRVGDTPVPLYVSTDGQINAQIPYELTAPANYQMVLRSGNVITVPESFNLSLTRPGIFTTNQQGTGQGVIFNTSGQLVDGANPAAAGDVLVIYTTGLGATDPVVASGAAAPSAEPLARVTNTVTATVGGQAATVQFAGLTPGFVGLYQVNIQIPAGLPPGSAVPVVLTQRSVPSNTVTIALK